MGFCSPPSTLSTSTFSPKPGKSDRSASQATAGDRTADVRGHTGRGKRVPGAGVLVRARGKAHPSVSANTIVQREKKASSLMHSVASCCSGCSQGAQSIQTKDEPRWSIKRSMVVTCQSGEQELHGRAMAAVSREPDMAAQARRDRATTARALAPPSLEHPQLAWLLVYPPALCVPI